MTSHTENFLLSEKELNGMSNVCNSLRLGELPVVEFWIFQCPVVFTLRSSIPHLLIMLKFIKAMMNERILFI